MRSRGGRLTGSLAAIPHVKRKVHNSWAAVQDTYFSAKELFEKHKVVFTIGTSMASVATAWAGYTLRHYHESKVEHRLQSIEQALLNSSNLEHSELKKLVDPGSSRAATWFATAATTFLLGYGFGFRGGRWYANRKFRKEQMKLLGQIKPTRWQLLQQIKSGGLQFQFLRKRLARYRASDSTVKTSEKMSKDVSTTQGG